MNRLISKLTTKPVWWWEHKRSYPIRSRHDLLPSLPVKQGARCFVVLTTPNTFNDALWAAWSWYRFLRDEGCSLHIAVDGAVTENQRRTAVRLFPGILVDSAQWACGYIRARVPGIQHFFDNHPMGRKLALILALSDREPLIYSDCDVLAFRRPDEFFASMSRNIPCYFSEEADGARDLQVTERARTTRPGLCSEIQRRILVYPQRCALDPISCSDSCDLESARRVMVRGADRPQFYAAAATC